MREKTCAQHAFCTQSNSLIKSAFTHSNASKSYSKVFCSNTKIDTQKPHDLLELLERATTHDPSLATWRDTLLVLNQFYIPVRYPDVLHGAVADGLPDAQESQQALQSAEAVFQALEPLLYSQAE